MSQKIASLYAEIGADTSKFEQGTKKVKSGLDQQAAAMAKFSADATRNAKSYLSYEAQKAKALAQTERAAAKLAKEEERAAKAAAKAAEAQRKANLVIAPGIEGRLKGLQEFTAANAGLISVAGAAVGAVVAIGVALNKTTQQVVEYGDQVVKLKTITGQSAEATSNTIQLADDMRVSYEKLTVALQFASKNGVDTSINGLAKLSEQYKTLAPGVERTEFLIKTFGKSGIDMARILELDSKAIKEFKANSGQILTEKDLQKIKEYNHAIDSFKDRLESAGNTFGKAFMPFKTFAADVGSLYIRALEIMQEKHVHIITALQMAGGEIQKEKAAFLAAGDAANEMGDGLDNLAEKQKSAEEQAKRMSDAYGNLLSSMFAIQNENENNAKKLEDFAKKEEDLKNQKAEALGDYLKRLNDSGKKENRINEDIAMNDAELADKRAAIQRKLSDVRADMATATAQQMESLQRKEAGLLDQLNSVGDGNAKNTIKNNRAIEDSQDANNEALADYMKKVQDLDNQLEELGKSREDLAKQEKDAANKRIYDIEQQRLSVDGLSSDEYKFLQDEAVNLGLATRASADRAIAESNSADQRVAAFMKVQDPMLTDLQIMQQLAQYSGTVVDFGINYYSNKPSTTYQGEAGNTYGTNGVNYSQMFQNGQSNPMSVPMASRDSGGPGIAGTPYMIGTGAQPEIFTPSTNGTFTPANKQTGGDTYNITINNPVPVKAEDSIRRELRKMSVIGAGAKTQ